LAFDCLDGLPAAKTGGIFSIHPETPVPQELLVIASNAANAGV
jgi:hypothetical protein